MPVKGISPLITGFQWQEGGIPPLNNGAGAITWLATPIATDGSAQYSLSCLNTGGSANAVIRLYYQGDKYPGSPSFETSLAAAAPAGGVTRYTASIAEYLIPPALAAGAATVGFTIMLPVATHFVFLGAYADSAPDPSQTLAVSVARQFRNYAERDAGVE